LSCATWTTIPNYNFDDDRNDDTAVEPLIKNDAFEGNEYEIITYFRRITTTTQRKNSALH